MYENVWCMRWYHQLHVHDVYVYIIHSSRYGMYDVWECITSCMYTTYTSTSYTAAGITGYIPVRVYSYYTSIYEYTPTIWVYSYYHMRSCNTLASWHNTRPTTRPIPPDTRRTTRPIPPDTGSCVSHHIRSYHIYIHTCCCIYWQTLSAPYHTIYGILYVCSMECSILCIYRQTLPAAYHTIYVVYYVYSTTLHIIL